MLQKTFGDSFLGPTTRYPLYTNRKTVRSYTGIRGAHSLDLWPNVTPDDDDGVCYDGATANFVNYYFMKPT